VRGAVCEAVRTACITESGPDLPRRRVDAHAVRSAGNHPFSPIMY
jgi:hypothetical protein